MNVRSHSLLLVALALFQIAPASAEPRAVPPNLDRMVRSHPNARELTRQFYATPSSQEDRNGAEIRLVFKKAFEDAKPPRIVRLHAKSRAAFNVPATTVSQYAMTFNGLSFFTTAASRTANEESGDAIAAGRAKVSKLGYPRILLADDRGRMDIWSNFVHESAHLRFGHYLEKNIGRLATSFPSYVRKSDNGYVMKNTLYHLLSEWYAFEMGYRAYDSAFGSALARENGGRPPSSYARPLPDARVRQGLMKDAIFQSYRINDPALQLAARGKTLGEFLKYGELGSREALKQHRAQTSR